MYTARREEISCFATPLARRVRKRATYFIRFYKNLILDYFFKFCCIISNFAIRISNVFAAMVVFWTYMLLTAFICPISL